MYFMMKLVLKNIINMKYLMGIVLMKMGHLRDIYVSLYQHIINLFYIFYVIYLLYFFFTH